MKLLILKKMKKLVFHKMWEAMVPVFDIDHGSIKPILETLPQIATFGDKEWFYYCKGGARGGAYFEEGEMAKAKENGLKTLLDKKYFEKYVKEINEMLGQEKNPIGRIISADLTKISNEELKQLLIDSTEYVVKLFGYYLACQPQCIVGIEELMQQKLGEVVPKEEVTGIFTLLSTPTTITALRQEEIDWLTLLINKNKKGLENHYEKYRLLHLGDGAGILPVDHYLKKYESEIKETPEKLKAKLEEIRNSTEKIRLEKEAVIKKYRIPKEIVEIGDVLSEIGHIRLEMRIRGWMPVQFYNDFIALEIGKRFGIKNNNILHATYEETLGLLNGKKIDNELLEERKNSYLFAIENGKARVYAGKEADMKFKQLVNEIDTSKIKEFKGNTAMKGSVRGTALVFRWGDDMNEKLASMTENTILVAGQTRPQLMPLIVKSKGIVTDEGGITSHAAIVSRELGVPCVIGTKIATQVLKDGDMIEVDANKGIVRIIA